MGGKPTPRQDSLAWLDRKYPTDAAVRRLFEKLIWRDAPYCPHCGSLKVWRFRDRDRASRDGLFQCGDCQAQFTVTTKTPMHATKLPLRTWLRAIYLVLMSSKGISSVVLGRQLGVTQKTAWKLAHAVREMMDDRQGLLPALKGVVEVDTTFMGGPPRSQSHRRFHKYVWNPRGKGTDRPEVIIATERDGKVVASVMEAKDAEAVEAFLKGKVAPEARLMSDADRAIAKAAEGFASHESVVHSKKEFVRGQVHSNTTEGVASILKRAQFGVFHQISRQHLQRYVDEMAFRWNQRTVVRQDGDGRRPKRKTVRKPFMEQLSDLLATAVGRQVRRSENWGLRWPAPVAPGYLPAPSGRHP